MQRTTLRAILALSLALSIGRADVPAGVQAKANHALDKTAHIMKASEQVQQILPGLPHESNDQKEPLLVAPGGCPGCKHLDFWEDFKSRPVRLFLL